MVEKEFRAFMDKARAGRKAPPLAPKRSAPPVVSWDAIQKRIAERVAAATARMVARAAEYERVADRRIVATTSTLGQEFARRAGR